MASEAEEYAKGNDFGAGRATSCEGRMATPGEGRVGAYKERRLKSQVKEPILTLRRNGWRGKDFMTNNTTTNQIPLKLLF